MQAHLVLTCTVYRYCLQSERKRPSCYIYSNVVINSTCNQFLTCQNIFKGRFSILEIPGTDDGNNYY